MRPTLSLPLAIPLLLAADRLGWSQNAGPSAPPDVKAGSPIPYAMTVGDMMNALVQPRSSAQFPAFVRERRRPTGNRADLEAATRALDRILLWNHYVVPQWYYNNVRSAVASTRSTTRQARWCEKITLE